MSYEVGFLEFPHLIAYATGINANAVANTSLIFINGGDLTNHIPFDLVIEHESGTYTLATVQLVADGINLDPSVTLTGLASTNRFSVDLKGQFVNNSGVLEVAVTIANGSAATFTAKVYGISI